MMKHKLLPVAILLMVSVALAAAAAQDAAQSLAANVTPASAPTAPNGKSDPQFQTRNPRYTIRSGDVFDVNFELSPEFNQTVTVQPDGFITLKGVGDIRVAGQTVPQFTQILHNAYDKILNDPLIAVVLKDFEKPYFVADGQVSHPGKYELRGDVTLTQAIAMAGGFNETAKHSQVLLFRRVNDDWLQAKVFNVKKMLKEGSLHEDPTLHPGDMLYVPKNAWSKVRPFIPNAGVGAYAPIP